MELTEIPRGRQPGEKSRGVGVIMSFVVLSPLWKGKLQLHVHSCTIDTHRKESMMQSSVVSFYVILCMLGLAVDGGERAVIWHRFNGVEEEVKGEGTHLRMPWIHVRTILGSEFFLLNRV
eukprot:gb/GECG01010056.1/.p1 GENE.gb/GECG01010056.1/~~gb/GECG01010056.1/.p1  ORF type:complete len:120 (+),score=10.92 gb/GECG01010056.1/:1-360(+)